MVASIATDSADPHSGVEQQTSALVATTRAPSGIASKAILSLRAGEGLIGRHDASIRVHSSSRS